MLRYVQIAAVAAAVVVLSPIAAHAAGPQVTDGADDAYRSSLGLPNPLLSDPTQDITAIEWALGARNEFTVTMTTTGTPASGVNYYPFARIGAEHIAFWVFRVGEAARYNIFREDPATGQRTTVSSTGGTAVRVVGNTISATFSTKQNALPAVLRQNPVLGPFGGYTCPAGGDCTGDTTVDQAASSPDARFALR